MRIEGLQWGYERGCNADKLDVQTKEWLANGVGYFDPQIITG